MSVFCVKKNIASLFPEEPLYAAGVKHITPELLSLLGLMTPDAKDCWAVYIYIYIYIEREREREREIERGMQKFFLNH
jgi:hypothetical protein